MVSDQEPRYQLLDSSGTVVGTFYQKADGTLAVQDGVSESEVVFDGDTIGSGSETVDVGSVSMNTATIDGNDAYGYPTSNHYQSTPVSLGSGYTVLDANNPVEWYVNVFAQTDGSTNGRIDIDIDPDADGTAELTTRATANSSLSNFDIVHEGFGGVVIPAGGQVRLENVSDPNGNNGVNTNQMIVLSQ